MATNVVASRPPERRPTATPTARANTNLAAPGSLAHRLKRRTDCEIQNGRQGLGFLIGALLLEKRARQKNEKETRKKLWK